MDLQFILEAFFNEFLHSVIVFIIYSWPLFDVAKITQNLYFQVTQFFSNF